MARTSGRRRELVGAVLAEPFTAWLPSSQNQSSSPGVHTGEPGLAHRHGHCLLQSCASLGAGIKPARKVTGII